MIVWVIKQKGMCGVRSISVKGERRADGLFIVEEEEWGVYDLFQGYIQHEDGEEENDDDEIWNTGCCSKRHGWVCMSSTMDVSIVVSLCSWCCGGKG